jgi:hypothetical protein
MWKFWGEARETEMRKMGGSKLVLVKFLISKFEFSSHSTHFKAVETRQEKDSNNKQRP